MPSLSTHLAAALVQAGDCCWRPRQPRSGSVLPAHQFTGCWTQSLGGTRNSDGSWLHDPARVCTCVRSSNGAHTARRETQPGRRSWPPGASRAEPPVWPVSSWWSTQLTFRYIGPRASPALPLPCSSCIRSTNSRPACRQLPAGAATITSPPPIIGAYAGNRSRATSGRRST